MNSIANMKRNVSLQRELCGARHNHKSISTSQQPTFRNQLGSTNSLYFQGAWADRIKSSAQVAEDHRGVYGEGKQGPRRRQRQIEKARRSPEDS
jgi:hypothetical protein